MFYGRFLRTGGFQATTSIAWLRACGLLVLMTVTFVTSPAGASSSLFRPPIRDRAALDQFLFHQSDCIGHHQDDGGSARRSGMMGCPDPHPVLRIETGTHTAPINRMGVDASCRIAATGSDDKTVRLWSLPEGRPIRVQRLAIGSGDRGKIYAVAVSPDGRLVAAGGWDTYDPNTGIYLFDVATGQTIRRIGAFGNVVHNLAFSPDGTRIAATNGDGGVHVLDVASGREIASDNDFTDDSYGVAYSPDGTLFVTGNDGFIRRYDADGHRTHKVRTQSGQKPFTIAVSPDGSRLAVGFADARTIELIDASTLAYRGIADTAGMKDDNFSRVAWSSDGRLFAGGDTSGVSTLHSFDAAGRRGPELPLPVHDLMDLKRCDTAMIFAAADPSIVLVRSNTEDVLVRSQSPDMRLKLAGAFMVSPDGRRVRFGLGLGGVRPALFDLVAGTVTETETAARDADLVMPDTTGLSVDRWQDKTGATLNGKPLGPDADEFIEAIAIRPDRQGFVLGGKWSLSAYSDTGGALWRNAVSAPIGGVNLARRGELIVVACEDGTLRWYRWSDGREVLAVFVHRTDRRFVAWTPSGYYMASPGAEGLIGWHFNRGWTQAADFVPASRFREKYARPDVVQRVLDTLDETEALRQADAARSAPSKIDPFPFIERLPPVIRIVAPADGGTLPSTGVRIEYRVRSPSGLVVEPGRRAGVHGPAWHA